MDSLNKQQDTQMRSLSADSSTVSVSPDGGILVNGVPFKGKVLYLDPEAEYQASLARCKSQSQGTDHSSQKVRRAKNNTAKCVRSLRARGIGMVVKFDQCQPRAGRKHITMIRTTSKGKIIYVKNGIEADASAQGLEQLYTQILGG